MTVTRSVVPSHQPEDVSPFRDMLAFAARWVDHGGGPTAEIAARFGMSDTAFFAAVTEAVATSEANHLPPARRMRVKVVAEKRIWLSSVSIRRSDARLLNAREPHRTR